MTPLQEAIEHWKDNLEKAKLGRLSYPDISPRNDPLCQKYLDEECTNCPIALKTGESDCINTPWDAVFKSINPTSPETVPCVEAMLAFLESCEDV